MAWESADQATYRRQQTVADQFGRKWTFPVENKTGHACGPVVPIGWSDPLATPQKYIDTTSTLGHAKIKFEQWIKDLTDGEKEWEHRLFEIGRELYKKVTPDEVKKFYTDPYLLGLAGPRPGAHLHKLVKTDVDGEPLETPVDLLRRAMNGEVTLLLNNEAIEAGVMIAGEPTEISWPEFLAEARKQGKTPEQASAAWQLLKAEKQLAGV